jgi:hypothetical protein
LHALSPSSLLLFTNTNRLGHPNFLPLRHKYVGGRETLYYDSFLFISTKIGKANMPSSTLTYLQHIPTPHIECPICKDPVEADAVNLSCHESILFCAECIGHWLGHSMRFRDVKVSCPNCRNRVEYSNFKAPQLSLKYDETLDMMDEDDEYNSLFADSDGNIEESEMEDEIMDSDEDGEEGDDEEENDEVKSRTTNVYTTVDSDVGLLIPLRYLELMPKL